MPINPADVPFYNATLQQLEQLQSQYNLVQQQISDLTAEAARLQDSINAAQDILDFIEGGSPSVPQLANPEGVLATAVDASEISVVWDAVSNADGYIIERSLSVNFLPNETEEVYNGDYGYGIFNDTDVIPQGHYFYRIKAYGTGYKPSNWSSVTDAVATNGVLTTPTFSAPVIGSNSILVSWGSVSDADTYVLYRSDDLGNTYFPIYEGGGTEYNDNALVQNTVYYYMLIARDTANNWTESLPATDDYTTIAGQVPDVVGFYAYYAGSDTMSISWDEVPQATSYTVERADDAGFTTNKVTVYTGDWAGGQPTLDTVVHSQYYYYRIKATRSGWQDSDWTVVSLYALLKLDDPENFVATDHNSMLGEWWLNVDPVSSADNYVVEALSTGGTEEIYNGNYASLTGSIHTTSYTASLVGFRVKAQGSGFADSDWAYWYKP